MALQQRSADRIKEREQQDDEAVKLMAKHARCAILPSPEKLDESIGSSGSDKTDTLRDFDLIKEWVTKSELLNTGFCDGTDGKDLKDVVYYSFIQLSFSTAFAAMRNTKSLELKELVFWYYAGHGLSKKAAQLSYSSTPCLDRVGLTPGYHKAADKFVKEGRKVKAGELCLHKVGFCDLYGLLKPWIDAIKVPINAEGRKKNKHLVIILDSCSSGIIAQELKDFEDQMKTKDPSFLKENSVTIQAACGPDQAALGGYFTPCFVYLNNPENIELLNYLKTIWKGMNNEERNEYRSIELPSPMVVTTWPQSQVSDDVTLEWTVQNFKLTLFQDPGFFKFCSIMVYKHVDNNWFNDKERVLDHTSAAGFMTSSTFTVVDYKLKTLVTGSHAGSPMGLFLLEDPTNPHYAVCAHIHFQIGNTNNPQRINLVHHKKPPVGSVLYTEDHDGLSHPQIKRSEHKIQVPPDANTQRLVEACRTYVERMEKGRWNDSSQWNMTGIDLGVSGLFRVQEQQKQRSAWEDSYLEHIKRFKIPLVADN